MPVMRSPEQARTIDEQFNNLPLAEQVQMMYTILNEEEIRLHIMIRATLEQIDIILQEQKSLQTQEEKLGQVLQMIIKVSQDLEMEENMDEQAKNSIKNLDKRITEVQNPSNHLFDVPHTTSITAARSTASIVQA